jgi:hypothetical protein
MTVNKIGQSDYTSYKTFDIYHPPLLFARHLSSRDARIHYEAWPRVSATSFSAESCISYFASPPLWFLGYWHCGLISNSKQSQRCFRECAMPVAGCNTS